MKTMRIIVIEPTAAPRIQEVKYGDDAYPDVKEIIGGYLEFLPLMPGVDAYIDEEAKLKGKFVVNGLATTLFRSIIAREGRVMLPGDFIAGPMVIIGSVDEKGECDGSWHDLRQADIDDIMGEVSKIIGGD